MQSIKELKKQARDSLHGHWKEAILLNLIPTLLKISIIITFTIFFTSLIISDSNPSTATLNSFERVHRISKTILNFISMLFISGISWTYLDIVRGTRAKIKPFKDALRGFNKLFILGVVLLTVLITIFTSLWTFLFIIPGIVKNFSYSQSYFIYYDVLKQNGKAPQILETITASRYLMKGYKIKLFCLHLSFIGWHILALLTVGIGYLWINPYIYTTKAAFYNDISSIQKKNKGNCYGSSVM